MRLNNSIDEKYLVYGMLFSLSNRIQTIGDKTFKAITLKQQFLMTSLGLFDCPPSLKEVGDLIGCSYQNVKRMADNLQKEGYLKITQDINNRRRLLLLSTGKYEQFTNDSQKVITDFINKLYENIPKEDLEITYKTLMKMDSNIGGIIE